MTDEHSTEEARLVAVLSEHRVTRDGISTSYFGPTLGWWRCTCGATSPKWKGFYRDREQGWADSHIAEALVSRFRPGKEE